MDNVMMRLSEMILSFPSLILAMIINAVMGSNLFNTMFALVIVAWPYLCPSDAKRGAERTVKMNTLLQRKRLVRQESVSLLKEIIPNSVSFCFDHGDHGYR